MTDPLGQSQVLPYLVGLSKMGYQFTLLSVEKDNRFEKFKDIIEAICKGSNITWVPLKFYTSPPIVSKFYNRYQLLKKAEELHRAQKFQHIHCRSYLAAEVGLVLKKKFGVPFLFDMRGFWADEKKESGLWSQDTWIYRKIYQYYKKQEKILVREASHIISLTYAGKKEMETWSFYDPSVPITVIPCCADMNHFSLTNNSEKNENRLKLGISKDTFVLTYLGAVGTWYMIDEMFQLFLELKKRHIKALFFFITHSNPQFILDKAQQNGISIEDVLIKEASRSEVPQFMKTADIAVSFIQPIYSKLSSSPTKLGEIMAMGIPVVTNSGVGDVAEIVSGRGIVLDALNETTLAGACAAIPDLLQMPAQDIRHRAQEWYDLDKGVGTYKQAYVSIEKSA